MIDWDEVQKLEALRQSGRPAEALEALQRIRVVCSDNESRASILLSESACYCDLSRFPEAVEASETALRLLPKESPSRPFAEFSLACAHEFNGELELAAGEIRVFLAGHQAFLATAEYYGLRREAQHRLAAILIMLNQATEAVFLLEMLEADASTSEELAELHYRQAKANEMLKRHDRALELFQQALAEPLAHRYLARAHFGVGEILYHRSDFQPALREFEDAAHLAEKGSPDHEAFNNWIRATRKELQRDSPEPLM